MHRTVVVAAGLVVALAISAGCASGRSTWTVGAVAVTESTTPAASAGVQTASPMASMTTDLAG